MNHSTIPIFLQKNVTNQIDSLVKEIYSFSSPSVSLSSSLIPHPLSEEGEKQMLKESSDLQSLIRNVVTIIQFCEPSSLDHEHSLKSRINAFAQINFQFLANLHHITQKIFDHEVLKVKFSSSAANPILYSDWVDMDCRQHLQDTLLRTKLLFVKNFFNDVELAKLILSDELYSQFFSYSSSSSSRKK